jgi:hypothetical protein
LLLKKKIWTSKNRSRVNVWQRRRRAERRKSDAIFVLNSRMGQGMRDSLKHEKRRYHWEKLVGYTTLELKQHLERLFTRGMTWKLFLLGKIHIDHVVPVSFFNYSRPQDAEFQYCWSLHNLQPLWGKDNLKKRDKINWRKHELDETE